jgi:hypothetical protein
MQTPDDLEPNQAAANDELADRTEAPVARPELSRAANTVPARWNWRAELSGLTSRFQRSSRVAETPTEADDDTVPVAPRTRTASLRALPPPVRERLRLRRGRRKRLEDWQSWSKFRLWRNTRPLWGSLLMIAAALIILVGASFLLPFAFLVQSIWPAFLIGGLLLVMGVIQLFLPTYAIVTGSIGMVLSLVSLLVASFGGYGLGLLLGVIGSALSIAWRPVKRSRLIASSNS